MSEPTSITAWLHQELVLVSAQPGTTIARGEAGARGRNNARTRPAVSAQARASPKSTPLHGPGALLACHGTSCVRLGAEEGPTEVW